MSQIDEDFDCNDYFDAYASCEFDGTIRKQTDKALLVFIDGQEIWLPKSQIENMPTVQKCLDKQITEVTLTLPQWLAESKGLA